MYTAHFSLREMPFSITPDPAFLYMSRHHQEALGHLLYGTGQYGGFVQLTGEVGTGKTTIVRTLLEQKLDDVDVAVILNPRQSEREFVQSICDELGVEYSRDDPTLKTLIDALNRHLLDAHSAGRRTVVLIDEAQNLQPDVLEQVRLLTNLETHKEKLLRIMLVGQPELTGLLARPDLRQLAQRITARYHLASLSRSETGDYVAHRLRIAGGRAELFTPRAIDRVHHHSGGIPRLVNIVCDRSLLGAYAAGRLDVTPTIVDRAAAEVGGERPTSRQTSRHWILDAALVTAILGVGVWWLTDLYRQPLPPSPPESVAANVVAAQPRAAMPPVLPVPKPGEPEPTMVPLESLLREARPLPIVLRTLTRLWDVNPDVGPGESLCEALSRDGIACLRGNGQWEDLRRFNLPAILTLKSGRRGDQHLLLSRLQVDGAVVDAGTGPHPVSLDSVDLLWTGEYLLLWRRGSGHIFIGPESVGEDVVWLRRALARVEGRTMMDPVSDQFDDALRESVRRFQQDRGLDPDGLAGAHTLIAISQANPQAGTPDLTGEGH